MNSPGPENGAPSLEQAMLRLASGDQRAFDQVFSAVWPPALRYAGQLLGGAPSAEDVAQRAMLRLFEEAPGYRGGSSVIAWALNLTYWEARTELQRIRRARALPMTEQDLVYEKNGALDVLLDQEAKHQLQQLLAELSEDEKCLLGLGEQRILEHLKPSTVRKRRQRLIDRLKRGLRDLIPGNKSDE